MFHSKRIKELEALAFDNETKILQLANHLGIKTCECGALIIEEEE